MNKPFLKRFPRFFFSSLWALGIFGLFVFDFSETTKDLPLIPYADKIVHALLFFVQTGLLLWELNFRNLTSTSIPVGRLFIWSVSLPFLYGVLIELIQHFLPYRGAELMDLLFDLMGSLAAFSCLVLILIWRENKR
ncbi:MAG: VanZ family protein [Bacteroidales bacterium]|jgi:VanZ family protein|nr:VanZ family protein [Bacteroidales bacterium]MDI9544518.1 VanZ family protein [Bacteroidota bacterium]MBP8982989.1 VanZ family protein [Bacteroidales bacterium]NLV39241.1 VanZ family protein [Bacteroidales bacterium]HNZ81170.1 VanZ family protein [Bacteroidales bacterium]